MLFLSFESLPKKKKKFEKEKKKRKKEINVHLAAKFNL